MKKSIIKAVLVLLSAAALVLACSTQRKARTLREKSLRAGLSLPREKEIIEPGVQSSAPRRDTLKVKDLDGTELLIMRAVRDEVTGEMVASEVLDAAVVTARFRNVAERRGEVDIEFQITVTDSLQDSDWQLRFYPLMMIMEDTVQLDPVYITGNGFRRSQTKGYELYERFLRDIARDSLYFVDYDQLERFLERNLPRVFKYRADTSVVSEEEFASAFGVTERQALEHYTNKGLVASNARKVKRKGKMWERYIKNPIEKEGIRLDTVMRTDKGTFVYNYVQTVRTRPGLRKVDIVLGGDIRDPRKQVYTMPRSAPLTFYISSLSAFADGTERYKTMVIERRAEANTACNVDFATGRSNIDLSLGGNEGETGRIRATLARLMENDTFDLDSVTVTASCSPDGSMRTNAELARRRTEAVTAHFRKFIRHYTDSLKKERGFSVDEEGNIVHNDDIPEIRMLARSIPEDWPGLSRLVEEDTVLTEAQKADFEAMMKAKDPDARERVLRGKRWYSERVVKDLYPRLRTVRFGFHLHRKGMVKDTVHTTILDTVYMSGVQAIRDRDYERAIEILRPYGDYNTAVAYVSMDYNASAKAILERLDKTAQVNYMLALICAREGDDGAAVQHYIHACKQEPSYVHRGNLDPEISALIKRYNLNVQKEEEFEYSF